MILTLAILYLVIQVLLFLISEKNICSELVPVLAVNTKISSPPMPPLSDIVETSDNNKVSAQVAQGRTYLSGEVSRSQWSHLVLR